MKLYIIRHGETEWNVQKRLQGVSDTNLNEKGIEMAKQTAEALKEIPFACCFTSPLKRAKDTAMYILRDRQVPVYEDARIREISFGGSVSWLSMAAACLFAAALTGCCVWACYREAKA